MPPGQRFQIHYQEQKRARQNAPGFLHAASLLLVPLLVAVGVVLVFIPGPAILFFFLAAVLLASHSRWLARILDGAELKLRLLISKLRIWWRQSTVAQKPVFRRLAASSRNIYRAARCSGRS